MTVADDAAVGAVLGRFEAGREALASGIAVVRLEGGTSNRTFRVTSPAGDWAVRLGGGQDRELGINRVAERQVHAAAAARGFAPAIVFADPADGVLVTRFVAGRSPTRAELASPAGLRALGSRLGALHALPPPRGVRRLNVYEVLAHYLELRDVAPGPVPRADIAARLRWSLASYRQAAVALCHNDLHHRNIIAGQELCFVDWEYGGVGDPVFELAAVIGYHDLDAAEREELLAAHGGGFKPDAVAPMCLVFDCLHALWLDVARGWEALEPARREALIARLRIDPADREQ